VYKFGLSIGMEETPKRRITFTPSLNEPVVERGGDVFTVEEDLNTEHCEQSPVFSSYIHGFHHPYFPAHRDDISNFFFIGFFFKDSVYFCKDKKY
jgi:hypothetical protein